MESASKATSSRPSPALAVLAGTLCVVLVTGCGGSGGDVGSQSSGGSQNRLAATANFPRPSNRSFRNLLQNMLQGPELAPSVTLLSPGQDRFAFALFDRGRRQIGDLDVVLYVAKGLDETAHGPYPARYEPIEVRPQFLSKTSSQNPDAAHAVYIAKLAFRGDGSYLVSAVTKLDRKLIATSPAQVRVRSSSPIPDVGDKAIRTHTPTVASVAGDVKQIDTRVPPDDMHDVDLVDALDHHRPVVLLFATPAHCLSRVCAPVVDVTEQVKAEYADRVVFIHMEVYNDNDRSKGVRPQFRAWGLKREPILFAINRRGVVVSRIEGAFSARELKAAVRRALH